jgi:high-affinity Fe2+/Pb2+ permease
MELISISIEIILFFLAPIVRANVKRDNRILGGIIAGLILSIISLTVLAFFIAYRK